MRIQFVEIQNFRKLKSIRVDFTPETTVFVGPNNSGKTSAMAALQHFLVDHRRFTPNDFSASNWVRINEIGDSWWAESQMPEPQLPTIEPWVDVLPCMDIWLHVENDEIYHVSKLLPTLDWEGGLLGVRLRLEPSDIDQFYTAYVAAVRKVSATVANVQSGAGTETQSLVLWPRSMREFLDRRLKTSFTVRAYALDPSKHAPPEKGIARPQQLPESSEAIDVECLRKLIRVDVINAQRDFIDATGRGESSTESGERRDSRRLSAQLKAYYDKHLDPQESPEPADLDALQAIQQAQALFDDRLKTGFSDRLGELENLGYPGVANPKITIATRIRLTDGLNHDAAVLYDLTGGDSKEGAAPLRLPEHYNGLGYQNLISIAFKLMSFRDSWMQVGKALGASETAATYFPPPLHLVLIEEPEAHLHAQVQQVFIRQAYGLLRAHEALRNSQTLITQLVVSTHSSHIAHECKFSSLRYFRRLAPHDPSAVPIATVVNLTEVFGDEDQTHQFITRYLKATHCDLFFADAAVFVEGPAERILLPQFLRTEFPELRHCYISMLEIGGSHAHRLRPLIEHLGLVTLVITDIDAATGPAGSARPPHRHEGQVTRNTTIRAWVPQMDSIDALLEMSESDKAKSYDDFFSVRVAFQKGLQVSLHGSGPAEALPYTFEDALLCENVDVFAKLQGEGTVGKFQQTLAASATPTELIQKTFDVLKDLKKAEFALDLLAIDEEPWPIRCPTYIREGLVWLKSQLHRAPKNETSNATEIQEAELVNA